MDCVGAYILRETMKYQKMVIAIVEKGKKMEIKDSGRRREFETGAVRDVDDNKGRCDLLPLDVVADYLKDSTLMNINRFKETGDTQYLYATIVCFITKRGWDAYTMFLEFAIHLANGARKYGEYNWQKGFPVHCYIDSAVRHYLKWLRGDKDEPHDRAFVWNIICCVWNINHHPALDDYTVKKDAVQSK
jgi:hypothetical protein